jgi:rod shape-determining protein MreC
MIRRIYNFLLLFREYAVFSLLLVVSLILMALNDNTQIRHIRGVATVMFGLVQEELAFIPRYFSLRSENDILRRMNVDLADEASQLREAKFENDRLRRLLGFKEMSRYPLIPATVVGKNLILLRNTLTLNAGKLEGVIPQMPVVGDGGLVGVVAHVSNHFSIVRILYNADFRASAKTERGRVDGILAWDGEELALTNVAKNLDVVAGDTLITSEYSSTYPPNIRIGTVREVDDQPGSLFKRVLVTPGVDFVKLEEVFVVSYLPDSDRTELEQSLQQKSRR